MSSFSKPKTNQAGFTLTELMVSIGIMILVLSMILVNYKKFDSGVVLTNLAYDIGLSVRKAQTYGISVKGQVVSSAQTFDSPFGIHFDSAIPGTYFIFADLSDPASSNYGIYDNQDSIVENFRFVSNFKIKQLCIIDTTNTRTCDGISNADITFKRPNPDANISVNNGQTRSINTLEVDVTSSQDPTVYKEIRIQLTGQISVRDCERSGNGPCI
jgi:type II secretory pathway pseudopilin PulG